MNLLTQIQTSAASDAVKENAAKYVEVIEKYAPCEPNTLYLNRAYTQAFGGQLNFLKLFWQSGNKELIFCIDLTESWVSTWFGIRRVLRFENPTESDFQQAFSWLKGAK